MCGGDHLSSVTRPLASPPYRSACCPAAVLRHATSSCVSLCFGTVGLAQAFRVALRFASDVGWFHSWDWSSQTRLLSLWCRLIAGGVLAAQEWGVADESVKQRGSRSALPLPVAHLIWKTGLTSTVLPSTSSLRVDVVLLRSVFSG